jgi:hypothetical protein
MDSKGYYEGNKRNLSEFTQYKNMDRPSLTGSYSGAYRADERNPAQPKGPGWIFCGKGVVLSDIYVCGSGALFFKIDFNGLLSPVSVTLGCNGVVISYKEGAEYTPEYECVV